MSLHRERALRCALRFSNEIQPHGCCFDACVLCLRLLVASVAGSPAGGRVGVFLTLDLVVRRSSTSGAGIEFWCSGTLCGSPVPYTPWRLGNLSIFLVRGCGSGFPPPTSGRSFIGSTSAGSCLLLWLTAVSLAFGLAFAVIYGAVGSRAGIDGRLASPPSGVAVGSILYTLDALCIDRFSGHSWPILDFPLSGFSAGLCRFFLA